MLFDDIFLAQTLTVKVFACVEDLHQCVQGVCSVGVTSHMLCGHIVNTCVGQCTHTSVSVCSDADVIDHCLPPSLYQSLDRPINISIDHSINQLIDQSAECTDVNSSYRSPKSCGVQRLRRCLSARCELAVSHWCTRERLEKIEFYGFGLRQLTIDL